ncbi:restriction endonuclease [Gammaproteobacteria bacterium]|nr:restriction endonuclease [Gammaproteobacteria bacterium]
MQQIFLIISSIFLNFLVCILLFSLVIPTDFFLLFLLVFPLSSYFIYRLITTNNRIKKRAIKSLENELSNLMEEQIGLVASAYRSSVSSNSFGKKNYSRFKKELLEHLIDNTESKDILKYANELGDFQIPEETIYKIEEIINEYSQSQEFTDDIDPYEYEHFCATQFLMNGWDEAEATSGSSDQGVDVIAKRGDEHLVGQCKKYQKPVGNSAVQEVVAGMGYYGANVGVVISNAGFTNSAKKLAEANNIKLIHHSEIKNL